LDCRLLVFFKHSTVLTSRNPKSNCCPLPHFRSTVRRKRSRLVHIQTVIQQAGG
jgi:hypothetical protein